jgi:hypothetical protein
MHGIRDHKKLKKKKYNKSISINLYKKIDVTDRWVLRRSSIV